MCLMHTYRVFLALEGRVMGGINFDDVSAEIAACRRSRTAPRDGPYTAPSAESSAHAADRANAQSSVSAETSAHAANRVGGRSPGVKPTACSCYPACAGSPGQSRRPGSN
jgi:hypothetical protein